jgi:orotate phosphoribosyltransferase
MSTNQYLKILEDVGAILTGHFVLSNGIHSEKYVQCSRFTRYPDITGKLCAGLIQKLNETMPNLEFDVIVSPAVGGIVLGYELGRQLNKMAIYTERVDGKMTFRRTFEIPKNANRVLLVEDVISSGKASMDTYNCIVEHGGTVVAEVALINRHDKEFNPPFPIVNLVDISVKTYEPDQVPEWLAKLPIDRPGSGWMNNNKVAV